MKLERILLKLTGEAFAGTAEFGIDRDLVERYAHEIKAVHDLGCRVAIVAGGSNIWRGRLAPQMDRATADYMGMIATVINALSLQDALEQEGVATRVLTAIEMRAVAEPFIKRRASRHLEKGRVVIFAAGTGNPYFSTDTTAALRALEIGAQALLKATHRIAPDDAHDTRLSYTQVLNENHVMDATAIALCSENRLPIHLFSLEAPEQMKRIVLGETIGTFVSGAAHASEQPEPAAT